MKIPAKLKVGGITYKVIKGYKFTEIELGGQACHTEAEIRLSDTGHGGREYAIEKKEEIFLHEILHAVDCIYNTGETEEAVIDRLSNGLYQVLKDNGLLK